MSAHAHAEGIREVVMLEYQWDAFIGWLRTRGLAVFQIPVENEGIPCYAICEEVRKP